MDLQEQATDSNTIDIYKIEAKKTMDESSQRIAFNLLNPNEKHYFRMGFINDFVSEKRLNENQIQAIKSLKDNFTVDVYKRTDYAEYFKNIYIFQWLENADRYFTTTDLYYLTTAHYENESSSQLRSNDCSCHLNSIIYCTKKRSTTYEISPDPSISVVTESVPCESQSCSQPQDENGDYEQMGCGFAWLHACNGTC